MATRSGLSGIKPPSALEIDTKTVRDAWRRWKQQWNDYCIVQAIAERPSEFQVSLFRIAIGPDAVNVLEAQPTPTDGDTELARDNVDTLIKMMDKFVLGQVNPTFERHLLRQRVQKPGESIETFVTDLKTMIRLCEVPDNFTDELIKDQIIHGIRDNALRERLLEVHGLKLTQCIDMCKAAEAASSHVKSMKSHTQDSETEVSHVKARQKRPKVRSHLRHKSPVPSPSNGHCHPECKFCGLKHRMVKSQCPAWGKACGTCGEMNHFARKCDTPMPSKKSKKPVRHVISEDYSSSESESGGLINAVGQPSEYCAKLIVQGKPVTFLLDTGSSTSLLPDTCVDTTQLKLGPSRILQMWNGTSERTCGTATLPVTNPATDRRHKIRFDVVPGGHRPVLGLTDVLRLDLVTINLDNVDRVLAIKPSKQTTKEDIIEKFADVFSDTLGTLPGEAHLSVDKSVQPVILPARNLPISLRPRVKKELNRLLELGVISTIDEPTDWVSQMVVVEKKRTDRVRLCIDPRPLNKALKREHYHLPTLEELLPELGNAKVFAKCDLRSGYWHVPLDQQSRKLTCCQSPFGRFIWNRLPFGLKVSSELFAKRLNAVFSDLPGVYNIADDVLIAGFGDDLQSAMPNLHTNLTTFLKRCSQQGVVLNPDKFEYGVTSVPFMGHLLTSQGLKADPDKVSAILNMPVPRDVAAVRRFNGTVNYLAKYLPSLSTVIKPLTTLTCKDAAWTWGPEHAKAFDTIKQLISSAPLLRHYNPEEDLVVQCDASKDGIGACLLQNGQPIAYASRTMTPAEQNYAQIEKETLAIVFAVEKFHQYTYGRTTLVQTDHKPLESILKKPLSKAPLRLQRMLLRLQAYDIVVTWTPGRTMLIADTLSRACIPVEKPRQQTFARVNAVDNLDLQPLEIHEIQTATATDPTLQSLLATVKTGWPDNKDTLPVCLHPYWSMREEISHDKGLLLKGERIIVPSACRKHIRDNLHESSHLGIDSCLRRARDTVYWPGMNAELKQHIKSCPTCAEYQPAQQKEPILRPTKPARPWEIVSSDIFTLSGKNYMVTVDHYSGFFEIDDLPTVSSETIIKKLKPHFSRYGVPVKFITDNARQYVSEEIELFFQAWKCKHKTSSPYYPKGNATAEATVKIAKSLMKKAHESKSDIYSALLAHRNTPKPDVGLSPAQLFLMRRARTPIPTSSKLLVPRLVKPPMAKLEQRERRIKRHYDQHAKALRSLNPGDPVRIKPVLPTQKTWEKGTITKTLDNRSYEIKHENGATTRRNRVHIRPAEHARPDHATEDGPSHENQPEASGLPTTRSGRTIKPVKRLGFSD